MSYKVGQILYLLLSDEMKIIPVQVVEVVVRHRFNEDTTISYNVIIPGKSGKIINLSDVNATAYTDIDELRKFMVDNAVQGINKMLGRAQEAAESHFITGLGPVQEEHEMV
jgi:hypothetical protein